MIINNTNLCRVKQQCGNSLIGPMLAIAVGTLVLTLGIEAMFSLKRLQQQLQLITSSQQESSLATQILSKAGFSSGSFWCGAKYKNIYDYAKRVKSYQALQIFNSPSSYGLGLLKPGNGKAISDSFLLVIRSIDNVCNYNSIIKKGVKQLALSCPYKFKAKQLLAIETCKYMLLFKIISAKRYSNYQKISLNHKLPIGLSNGAIIANYKQQAYYLAQGRHKTSLYEQNTQGVRQALVPNIKAWSLSYMHQDDHAVWLKFQIIGSDKIHMLVISSFYEK